MFFVWLVLFVCVLLLLLFWSGPFSCGRPRVQYKINRFPVFVTKRAGRMIAPSVCQALWLLKACTSISISAFLDTPCARYSVTAFSYSRCIFKAKRLKDLLFIIRIMKVVLDRL